MPDEQRYVSLLQLPDPSLVVVLRCCADDPRSVCSAARAHSRLHQAALLALSSVIAYGHQQQVDSLLGGYLAKYGTHIDSISLEGEDGPEVRQLPQSLTKLSSLAFDNSLVQMLPGDGYQGVLGAAAAAPLPLKQLRLNNSKVLDSYEGREGLMEFEGRCLIVMRDGGVRGVRG